MHTVQDHDRPSGASPESSGHPSRGAEHSAHVEADSTLIYAQPEHGQPAISVASAGVGGIARSGRLLLAAAAAAGGWEVEAAPTVEVSRFWAKARLAARILSSFDVALSTERPPEGCCCMLRGAKFESSLLRVCTVLGYF